MILYKHPELKDELENAPLLLQIIVKDLANFCSEEFEKNITITRVLGRIEGDSGVHADYRAVDIRDEYAGEMSFNLEEREMILDYINSKYYRNDGKKTAIHHEFSDMNLHFHIQIASSVKAYMKG